MRKFAWLTLFTGLLLSGIAAFFSVFGLALIYAGAFWSVVVLASTLEIAKLVAVTWMYRYRNLTGRGVRTYFYAAIATLMLVTSLGIFGFLTRAHVETEGTAITAELTLQEVLAREAQLTIERDQINAELKALNEQSSQLVTQLGAAQRLRGSQGAVAVQRENATRRTTLLAELKRLNTELSVAQKERITIETETNKATADIGPLRYVAQAVYGTDNIATIRKAVVTLTVILMIVFDPMAIMLLIAANVLFLRTQRLPSKPQTSTTVIASTNDTPPISAIETVVPVDDLHEPAIESNGLIDESLLDPSTTDVPDHLIRKL